MMASVAKAASGAELEALAEEYEPALANAVSALLREHVDRVSLDDLETALKTGDRQGVLDIIGEVDPLRAGDVRTALEDTVWAGGQFAMQSPVLRQAQFAFNRLNPALTDWLQTYSLNLIRQINDGTREGVRLALTKGMIEGRNPIDQARQIRESVGLTAKQANAVAAYRKELETFHLKRSAKAWGLGNSRSKIHGLDVLIVDEQGRPKDGITARRLRDLRYDRSLSRAMETSTPLKPDQIAKMVERYQQKYLKYRAQTIARTESLRAANVGAQEAWRQAIGDRKLDANLVRKTWLVSKDERLCPVCASIPGANPKRGVRLDQNFAVPKRESIALPPQHPNCRCTVQIRLWEPIQLFSEAA